MGNWRAFIPIALSLVIAVAGSIFLYNWIERQRGPKEIVQVEKTEAAPIAVAAANLPWGTKLTPQMIKMVPFLKESLPPGYFASATDLKGRISVTPLKLNEPITDHKLAPDSVTTGGVSAILKPGTRAIAVKGDKIIGISGFVNPGNRVDVIVTVTDPESKKVKAKIMLENLLILASGTQVQRNEKGEPMPVDVYTLEVTPEDAEKLALAASNGKLQFALRNMMDLESVSTKGVTIPEILATSRWSELQNPAPLIQAEPEKIANLKPKPTKKKRWVPRRSITVEIIKGVELTKKKFGL
jgi:pilus assembly protein CpaB